MHPPSCPAPARASLRVTALFHRLAAGALVLLLALSSLPRVVAAQPARPLNIVFVMLDNVGQEWFGAYGSEENCTPNIDRLARTGVRLENCYTPPVCGPSRTVLLTGRYPHTTGFRLHSTAAAGSIRGARFSSRGCFATPATSPASLANGRSTISTTSPMPSPAMVSWNRSSDPAAWIATTSASQR